MENNANQLNQNLCKKNCGFFGSSAFDGYCSKCYKDHVKRQNSGTAAGVLQSNLNSSSTNILTTTTTTTATDIPNTIDSTTTTTTISNNEPIGVDNVETPQQPQVVLPDNAIEIDNQQPTVTFTLQQEEQEPQQVKQQPEQQLLQAQPIAVDEASSSSQDMSPVASSGDLTSANDNKTKKKTRCMVDTCRRKVGLTGFDCRCGGLYCGEHRYSDKHNCNFDYKQHGQDQIRKNNPIVVGEKIQKL